GSARRRPGARGAGGGPGRTRARRHGLCRGVGVSLAVTEGHMELIIGPRLYSTWSLRPWLVLKRCKADFTVREIDIYSPEGQVELERISPSRLVPLLKVDGETIWDS